MLAFLDSLGFQEMIVLLIIGLILYGRDLPEAGRNLGQMVAKLKRGFREFKEQIDRDGQLREVKKVLHDTAREVKNIGAVPRAIADPSRALRDLTNEALSSPVPPTKVSTPIANGDALPVPPVPPTTAAPPTPEAPSD